MLQHPDRLPRCSIYERKPIHTGDIYICIYIYRFYILVLHIGLAQRYVGLGLAFYTSGLSVQGVSKERGERDGKKMKGDDGMME